MTLKRFAAGAGLLAFGLLIVTASIGQAQEGAGNPNPNDTEILARGPLHEAFASPVNAQPQPTGVVPKQPPDPIAELPPDQKPAGDNVQWYPGYWSWDGDRNDYVWISGVWRVPPPGQQYVPGHWAQAAGGWQWTPGFWAGAGQQDVQYLPPPPAPVDAAASSPAPNDGSVYVPGTWVYRETRYLWRPGYWVDYRPGWVWIPAHYVWTPVGFVFVDGYWDLDLNRRGLAFAPVYFRRPLWLGASWTYRPSYVVYNDFLRGALFIRPGLSSYFFGDYFDLSYRQRGFVTWMDFRFGRAGFDPLFSYDRWAHRGDPRWARDMRTLYTSRFNGDVARPPRTLIQQNTIVNNITVNNVTNIRNVAGLASLAKVDRTVVNLRPISQQQMVVDRRHAENLRQVSQQRGQLETRLVARGTTVLTARSAPQTVRLDLPKQVITGGAPEHMRPPTRPVEAVRVTKPSDIHPATGGRAGASVLPHGDTKPPARTEAKPPPKTESKPPKTESKPPKTESKPPPKIESKPPKIESKPPPKIESKPPPKIESKPPKIESKPPPKIESKPPKIASKPPPKIESKPPKIELKPPPKTESKPPAKPSPEKHDAGKTSKPDTKH